MKTEKTPINLRIEPDNLERLDKYAKKLKISRNQLILNLLTVGLDDLRLLDRSGMLVVGMGFRKLVDQLRRTEDGQDMLIE